MFSQRQYVPTLCLFLLLALPGIAHAEKFPRSSMDERLLRSDAVVFATVAAIGEGPGRRSLLLEQIDVVTSRWPIGEQLALSLQLPVTEDASAQVIRPLPYQPLLVVGRRYLLFLRGGEPGHPFVDFTEAIYALSDDGTVKCPGGIVFGIAPDGFNCSVVEREAVLPLLGNELQLLLEDAAVAARRRRPELAADEDAAARKLGGTP